MDDNMTEQDAMRHLSIVVVCGAWLSKMPEPESIADRALIALLHVASEAKTLDVAESAVGAIIEWLDRSGSGDVLREKLNHFQAVFSGDVLE